MLISDRKTGSSDARGETYVQREDFIKMNLKNKLEMWRIDLSCSG
jgi:hypothetical protein